MSHLKWAQREEVVFGQPQASDMGLMSSIAASYPGLALHEPAHCPPSPYSSTSKSISVGVGTCTKPVDLGLSLWKRRLSCFFASCATPLERGTRVEHVMSKRSNRTLGLEKLSEECSLDEMRFHIEGEQNQPSQVVRVLTDSVEL